MQQDRAQAVRQPQARRLQARQLQVRQFQRWRLRLQLVAVMAAVALTACSLGGCAGPGGSSPWPSLPRALRIASAATSHTLCASTFISGQDPDQVWQHEVRPEPGMGLVAWALRWQVDTQRREVRTTLAGIAASRAVFRPGEGCLLVPRETTPPPPATPALPPLPPLPPDPAGDALVPAPAGPLQHAVAAAFDENPQRPFKHTQAVVVLHQGRLVAEQYAPGVGLHSALSGHSISKSVAHALVGVLVQQGRLLLDQPAVPAWQQPGDARAGITVDHLLRMASGLPADETHGGWDAATRMWFDERDMAGFAMQGQPEAPPMTVWHYSNRSTLLLSRLVRDGAGGSAAAVRQWAATGLFQPLGMRDVTIRFDATGTPVLSSDVYASARDMARFGQLYLDDGWASGRQILPAGWVQHARTPTLGTGYGAGFWLNTTDARNEWGGRWGLPGAPADAFFGRGHLGQYLVVVPSRQLVVVRLGWSHRPDGEITSVGRLVAGVVRWVDSGAAAAPAAGAGP